MNTENKDGHNSQMTLKAKVISILGLPADSSEEVVIAAVRELQKRRIQTEPARPSSRGALKCSTKLDHRVKEIVAAYDRADHEMHKAESKRSAFLHHGGQLSGLPPDEVDARLRGHNSQIEELKSAKAKALIELEAALPKLIEILEGLADSGEVLAFLKTEESVLVRCERAAEFVEAATTAK